MRERQREWLDDLDEVKGRSPDILYNYEHTLGFRNEWLASIDEPPAESEITQSDIAAFRGWMGE